MVSRRRWAVKKLPNAEPKSSEIVPKSSPWPPPPPPSFPAPPPPKRLQVLEGWGRGGWNAARFLGYFWRILGPLRLAGFVLPMTEPWGGGLLGVSKLHWRAGGWGRGGGRGAARHFASCHTSHPGVSRYIAACRDVSWLALRVVLSPHVTACAQCSRPSVSPYRSNGGNWRGGGAPPRPPPCAGGALHFGLVSPHFGAAVSPPDGEGGLCAPMGNAAPPAAKGCERQCQHWHRAVTDGGGTWLQPE